MSEYNLNDYRRLAEGCNWFGFLTFDNLDLVADRIRSMIGDGQPYTWVAANEMFGLRPEVRGGQVATSIRAEQRTLDGGAEYGHLMVVDTYGVWGLHTTAATQDEAAVKDGRGRTYLLFERGQLVAEHFAPAGHRLCWVIAPEGGAR
ncbi:hypothetical protein GCM10017559_07850 [Streptosporangium longisporum]|uniref:Uncharacterized protein n=1 Tax=Streptosporangium longisporum TaxID=46187 RepID=A0ABN3XRH2_9ACTN